MQIGLALPTSTPNARGDTILNFARIAEQGGLHSVWSIDRLVFPAVDALAALAAVAGATSRVRLGTDVLISTTREPVHLATEVASIDVMSGGRMILGVGVGSREEDYTASGRDFHTRGRRMEEDIALIRRVWAGDPVVTGFGAAGPRPVQDPLPILMGGSSERAIARCARLADGHLSIPRGYVHQEPKIAQFRAAWTAAGRSGRPLVYAGEYYCVDPSRGTGQQRIMDYQNHYYGNRRRQSGSPPNPAEFDLAGSPEEIARSMLAYDKLEVDLFILFPVSDDPAQAEAVVGPVLDAYRRAGGRVG